MRRLLWLAIIPVFLLAQNPNVSVRPTTANPAGVSCSNPSMVYYQPTGKLFTCVSGTFTEVPGTYTLPPASAAAIGGVNSITAAANNWISYIDTAGLPHQSQPASTNLSDSTGLVRGAATLSTANIVPKISSAGTLGPSALKDDGTYVADVAARNWGIGTWNRPGNPDPTAKLDVFGGNQEIQNGGSLASESLNETDFATHVKWAVTGDFAFDASSVTFTYASGVGTLTQAAADLAIAGKGSRWYKFVYTLTGASPGDLACYITTSFASATQTLLVGTANVAYFKSAATPTDFVLGCSGTSGVLTFDDVSLKEVTGGNINAGGKISGGNLQASGLSGSGTAFACLDDYGNLTRSATACVAP